MDHYFEPFHDLCKKLIARNLRGFLLLVPKTLDLFTPAMAHHILWLFREIYNYVYLSLPAKFLGRIVQSALSPCFVTGWKTEEKKWNKIYPTPVSEEAKHTNIFLVYELKAMFYTYRLYRSLIQNHFLFHSLMNTDPLLLPDAPSSIHVGTHFSHLV